MREEINASIREYLRENLGIYMVIGIFFVIGVLGGAFALRYMEPGMIGDLADNFSIFAQGLEDGSGFDYGSIFRTSIWQNFRQLILICIAGTFIHGFPLIALLVGLRGAVIGFTVAFLIENASMEGVLFSLAAVAPHNLIVIPAFIMVAATGFAFSFRRFRENYIEKRPRPISEDLFSYGRTIFYLSLILILGSLVETYVSMLFMRITVPILLG